eukprot:SAG22_NODE_2898_length_2117_cov_7.540634_1_plen_30_part_10
MIVYFWLACMRAIAIAARGRAPRARPAPAA